MTSPPPPTATTRDPARRTVPGSPSPSQVLLLQNIRGYPCVSLLMNTTPAAAMTAHDGAALRQLARKAATRLQQEQSPGAQAGVLDNLDRLVAEAADGPTDTAIAVYASAATATVLRLPVTVRDRVVIDPTFATRDLVRSMHRTPRHVVLVLSSTEARLFDGAAGALRPAVGTAFPLRVEPAQHDPARPGRKDAGTTAFYRAVDRALGVYLRLHPAPVVLVGPDRALSAFTGLSRSLTRLAGTITGNLAKAPLADLAARMKPVLEAYLLSRQSEALALLERRASADRVVAGMPAAWLAARRERPEMLAVEEGLFYPAQLGDDGDLLTPATDVEDPAVIDDAVDELIELVLDRGGWVALVTDGGLAGHQRVALTVRGRD